ncbi:MAG: hypothetical protein AB7S77_08895 [Desulfatirhabdiaceae bacterium]
MTRETSSALTLILMLTVFLQIVFIFADTRDAPDKAVRQFTSMYYKLDPAMTSLMCENLISDDENVVENYIQKAGIEASERGFDISYLKLQLYNVRTHIIKCDDTSAMIRITGEMKRGINPLFSYVGKLFFIGKTYPLDQTVNVIRENGKWKVCQGFFTASET